jgi:hypothetical protein
LEVEKFAQGGLIGHVTKFVKDDEKSVISRRMAREPSAAHPALGLAAARREAACGGTPPWGRA